MFDKPKIIIGIDPGHLGAIAGIGTTARKIEFVYDMPTLIVKAPGRKTKVKTILNEAAIMELLKSFVQNFDISLVVIEKSQVFQDQGAVSAGTIMGEFKFICGIAETLGIPALYPPPSVWKKFIFKDFANAINIKMLTKYQLKKVLKKNSITLCKQLFPNAPLIISAKENRKPVESSDRAEAILLAVFGMQIKKNIE